MSALGLLVLLLVLVALAGGTFGPHLLYLLLVVAIVFAIVDLVSRRRL